MEFVDEEKKSQTAKEKKLPMDIIHDILLRLRVKTLCKFLCVSKSWYALISDPIFQSSHDRRAKDNPFVIVTKSIRCDPTRRCEDIHLSLLDSKGNLVEKLIIKPEASNIRHTLLSGITTCPDLVFVDDRKNVYVCNTINKDLIKMPPTSRRKYSDKLSSSYVLAHVASTKEYKLLAIGLFNQPNECEVITIGDDCWRTVSNPPMPITTNTGVHVDEAIYMMAKVDNDNDNDRYVKGIVRFDLDREEWSVVPTPPGHSFRGLLSYILGGTGEQLWVAEWSLLWEEFDLWSLKDHDKGIWMRECKVRMPFPDLHSYSFFLPIAIDNDGRILINMCESANASKCKILLCNSDGRNNFQVILEYEIYNVGRISFYVESFDYLKCLAYAKARGTKGERTW